jgi:hypothetical protein
MTMPTADAQRFLDLLTDLAEEQFPPEKAAALGELLQADSARPQEYVEFMLMVSGLHWISRDRADGEWVADADDSAADRLSLGNAPGPGRTLPIAATDPAALPGPAPAAPACETLSWLGGGVPLCYAMATLLLGALIAASWTWPMPAGREVSEKAWQGEADGDRSGPAGQLSSAAPVARQAPPPAAAQAKMAIVARITRLRGLILGPWTRPDEAPRNPADVPLGCLYVMGPGAIEIVYNSGTKVIVEGPAKYLVNSANGGALLLGKLRVTVNQKRKAGNRDSQPEGRGGLAASDGTSPPRPPDSESGVARVPPPSLSPLFTLRTRNAILTMGDADLEVWTDASGEARADVIRGKVNLGLPPGYSDPDTYAVRANGWIHVTRVPRGERIVVCNPDGPPEVFARCLPDGAADYPGTPGREKPPRQQQLLPSSIPDS